ncbi:hypothetical protein AC1031_009321 [Aphanomyces cochlioides]|nr:hypothetical protein AC1031_009321 [Aphanomyces cochlioides]
MTTTLLSTKVAACCDTLSLQEAWVFAKKPQLKAVRDAFEETPCESNETIVVDSLLPLAVSVFFHVGALMDCVGPHGRELVAVLAHGHDPDDVRPIGHVRDGAGRLFPSIRGPSGGSPFERGTEDEKTHNGRKGGEPKLIRMEAG